MNAVGWAVFGIGAVGGAISTMAIIDARKQFRKAMEWASRYQQLRREMDGHARDFVSAVYGDDAQIVALHALIIKANGEYIWCDTADRPIQLHTLGKGAEDGAELPAQAGGGGD